MWHWICWIFCFMVLSLCVTAAGVHVDMCFNGLLGRVVALQREMAALRAELQTWRNEQR